MEACNAFSAPSQLLFELLLQQILLQHTVEYNRLSYKASKLVSTPLQQASAPQTSQIQ